MALSWDVTGCRDHEQMQKEESGITDLVIYMCMFVGIPRITEETIDAFEERAMIIQASGPMMNVRMPDGSTKAMYLTREHLERRIGLHTNASKLSKAQFIKNQWDSLVRSTKRAAVNHNGEVRDIIAEMEQQRA